MASYAIGDIQGCFAPFQQLLRKIDFNPGKDTLWLTGDLVNRGPESLEVLRWVYRHQDCVQTVLGNHDLHLLAVSEGFGKVHASDTILDILHAADGKVLLDWLRCQPLMIAGDGYAMVHAGLLPEWTIDRALDLAEEVENELAGPGYREFLARLYGNKPTRWSEELRGVERLRLIVNAMTRMRLVTRDGEIDLSFKGELADAPANLMPWFAVERRRSQGTPIICGHWSALGLFVTDEILAIDTGCLWGGSLTALRLEDRQLFSLECQAYQAIA
ncbi:MULTISPECIES: symmetrical bis(5'-nucleosyl)-tetraphosphatase [unclassified Paludibacterium]|uniref:symmetrical bis(5'-nucleosyl)-tetraphosphatase n=1 Tax=unclassified Paludibacterium TaxID=2618429 RepID=UPI001C045FEB|nr:symmetrical bis(5'-nucleosyl)-tetraphosphatase [Paludibacterium sp. B53371]BEV73272.1 symmetrical bis(5'-nucleosyl)-tetraphosphatase [Paludibacterium sp. THUN1379]